MTQTYDIFARKEYAEPLTHIGAVDAPGPGDVAGIALATFGPAENWLEMIAAPRRKIMVVFSEENGGDTP